MFKLWAHLCPSAHTGDVFCLASVCKLYGNVLHGLCYTGQCVPHTLISSAEINFLSLLRLNSVCYGMTFSASWMPVFKFLLLSTHWACLIGLIFEGICYSAMCQSFHLSCRFQVSPSLWGLLYEVHVLAVLLVCKSPLRSLNCSCHTPAVIVGLWQSVKVKNRLCPQHFQPSACLLGNAPWCC